MHNSVRPESFKFRGPLSSLMFVPPASPRSCVPLARMLNSSVPRRCTKLWASPKRTRHPTHVHFLVLVRGGCGVGEAILRLLVSTTSGSQGLRMARPKLGDVGLIRKWAQSRSRRKNAVEPTDRWTHRGPALAQTIAFLHCGPNRSPPPGGRGVRRTKQNSETTSV